MKKFGWRAIVFFALALTINNLPLTIVSAQQTTLSRSAIPRVPTDTLPTDRPEVRLVTFADGTFRFIPTNPFHFLSTPVYSSNWDTLNLFAYRNVELSSLPDRIPLEFAASHGFCAPVTGRVLSVYGRRSGRDHNGIDIRVDHGQPVFAAFDGVVRWSRWNSGGFGNLVVIRHPNGLETYYAHLSRRAVVASEWVRAGQVIGYGGRTGRASALHLHFEIRYADQSFDPERLIDFRQGTLRASVYSLRKEHFSIRSRAVEGTDEDEFPLPAASSTEVVLASADTFDSAASPAPDPEPLYHKIVSGDTLLALALRYKTSVARLCDLNGISRTTSLRIGRSLRIK